MNSLKTALLEPGAAIGEAGRYCIEGTIAAGRTTCVYRASDTRLGTDCAVKTIALGEALQSDALAKFHREASTLAGLHHPGVVGVRDFFEENDLAILVMDYVAGFSLFDIHKDPVDAARDVLCDLAPAPESTVVAYGMMLAQTLSRLHRHDPPIIYGALDPHNVIRREADGQLILLEFGVASDIRRSAASAGGAGASPYASPEQYRSFANEDARSDIYSLGVLLHELATGYNPRKARGLTPPPRPADVRPTLTQPLARILERCCQPAPNCRYASAGDLFDDLDRLAPIKIAGANRSPAAASPAWTFNLGAPVTSALLSLGSAVYYADNGGMICAIDSATGEPLWIYREPGDRSTPSQIHTSLLTVGSDIFFAYSFPMDHGRQGVSVLDGRTGAAVWRSHDAVGKTAAPGLTQSGQVIIAASDPDRLIGVAISSARPDWEKQRQAPPISLRIAPPAKSRPELAIFTDRVGSVRAINCETGRTFWSNSVSHGPIVAPLAFFGDILFLGGARGDTSYAGLNVNTGELLWRTPLAAEVIGPAAMAADGLLVVPTRNAGLFGIDAATGRKVWQDVRFTKPLTGAATLRGGELIAVTEYGDHGRILIVTASSEPEILWESPLGPGGAVAPPLVTGEFLVAAAEDGVVSAWALT